MLRNTRCGSCYRCGEFVGVGAGHVERRGVNWRLQHIECAIWWRGKPQPRREQAAARRAQFLTAQTRLTA